MGGIAEETPLLASPEQKFPEDWSKDGRFIVYESQGGLSALPLFGDRRPITVLRTPFLVDEPHFSFDGRWIAYNSDESGTWQVYVMPFPPSGQKQQVSTQGGGQARWRSNGKELFYLALDGKLMAVDVKPGSTLEVGIPKILFDTQIAVNPIIDQYAVTPDGQRFLVNVPLPGSSTLTVLVNWTALLRQQGK